MEKENQHRLYVPELEKDSCGIELLANNNLSNMEHIGGSGNQAKEQNQNKVFSFEMSILKGIKLNSRGYDKEDITHIIKNLFSPRRPLFWLIITKAIALGYLIIRHSNIVLEVLKSPP